MIHYTTVLSNIFETDKKHNAKDLIISRGLEGIQYYKDAISQIEKYSRKKAISELIKSQKINEKISAIEIYMKHLKAE